MHKSSTDKQFLPEKTKVEIKKTAKRNFIFNID